VSILSWVGPDDTVPSRPLLRSGPIQLLINIAAHCATIFIVVYLSACSVVRPSHLIPAGPSEVGDRRTHCRLRFFFFWEQLFSLSVTDGEGERWEKPAALFRLIFFRTMFSLDCLRVPDWLIAMVVPAEASLEVIHDQYWIKSNEKHLPHLRVHGSLTIFFFIKKNRVFYSEMVRGKLDSRK
jgi:hypothetical protein